MNLEEYRVVFAVGSLILILVAAVPTLSLVLSFPDGTTKFSEFWILGPNHLMQDYPFDVQMNQPYQVYVGIRNHMRSTIHYMVYVKLRNLTQPLPDTINSKPSSLPPLYEYNAYVANNETWEVPLTFSILETSRVGDYSLINAISINDVVFSVDASTTWSSEQHGFYYELFLELWFYDTSLQSFQFHDRFVGIFLNMTG